MLSLTHSGAAQAGDVAECAVDVPSFVLVTAANERHTNESVD